MQGVWVDGMMSQINKNITTKITDSQVKKSAFFSSTLPFSLPSIHSANHNILVTSL